MATDNDTSREPEETGSILPGLSKKPTYSVPEGYFEKLPPAILKQVRAPKVVRIEPRNGIWRFAAAAVAAGVILTGSWLLLKQPAADTGVAASPATAIDRQMQQLSESDIAAFLDSNDISPIDQYSATADISDDDLTLVLAEVSEQELQQYLDQGDLFTEKFN